MNILYIHQYFNTPNEGGSTRSYWISKELIKKGHDVFVITSTRDKAENNTLKDIDGIKVLYKDSYTIRSSSLIKRAWAYFSFMFVSTATAWKQKNIDLVIATSTPLTIGFPALVLKKFKGTPYLFEVRDLWPEVPIQMGGLRNPLARKLARWFERTIYKNAKHVVALSPGMAQGVIEAGTPKDKVTMIPNMSKIDKFYIRDKQWSLVTKYSLKKDSFKIIYFGNMGLSNAIDYVLDGISILKEKKDIEFIFLGYGDKIKEIKRRKKEENLENVHFLGRFNINETSEMVNLCDASLVTFTNLPILYTNSPNKLFDSLSAGKPIIVNSPGWTKKMIEQHKCGIFVDPTSPQDFADKIVALKESPEAVAAMGQNSRKLAETTYDKSILCTQFADVVDNLDL